MRWEVELSFKLDKSAYRLADNLLYAAKDPNWRRRPSVLDQYRGWKKQPLARQRRGAQPPAAN